MDCKELENPLLLIQLFQEQNEKDLNRIFSCFYKNYYNQFVYMVHNIARTHSFLKGDPDFYGNQAFADALLSFKEKLSKSGFTEGKAKIKTFFFTFCLFKLKAIITNNNREKVKMDKIVKGIDNTATFILLEEDLYNEQEILLEKALSLLDEKSRQYIIFRKIDNLTNEQIAGKMGIQPASVNNEVYKSVIKLKEKIKFLKGKK